jgi:hypothetical protein
VNAILTELFSADGTELYMRPARAFVDVARNEELSFWEVGLCTKFFW